VNILANLLDSIPKDIIHVDVAMSTASCMNFERIFGARTVAALTGRIGPSPNLFAKLCVDKVPSRWIIKNGIPKKSAETALIGTVGAVAFSQF